MVWVKGTTLVCWFCDADLSNQLPSKIAVFVVGYFMHPFGLVVRCSSKAKPVVCARSLGEKGHSA